jgi:O-antigen ligase
MRFLYDNIATFAVFSVCATFAWLFGGIRADHLVPVVPWMTAILLEVLVCFPQRHSGETTYEARERVWDGVRHDPLTWVSLGFLALLLIPFVNVGLCPICDYPAIAAGADPSPTVPFLPFCVNRLHHLNVVLWFLPTLLAAVTARHALLKRGKRLVLELVVWNGLLLGFIGAAQQMTSAVGPLWSAASAQTAYFFSTFGYPNMAGDYFTTLFGLSVGLWRWRVDEVDRGDSAHVEKVRHVRFWKKHYFLIPAVIFFFCALDTLSRAAIILVTVLAVLFFLHAFLCFFSKMKKANRVRTSAISALVLSAITLCAVVFMPEDLQKEIDTLGTTEVLDRVTGKGQYHVRVATQIWKENFFFGVGGWGYKHFCIPAMTEKELAQQQKVGGINVHNDYLQFLAEHGIAGFALLVAVVVLLLWPLGRVWKAMLESVRFLPNKEQPPQPVQIFVLPAPVFCILATAIATFVHGFADCPLRSPAVLSLFFVSLACMDGFLPHIRRS